MRTQCHRYSSLRRIFADPLLNYMSARDLEQFDKHLKLRCPWILEPSLAGWPAPGSKDTELGVLMELEVGYGETEVYPRVQA
jgi:hypothetical protein